MLNFLQFLSGRGARLADVAVVDLFDYLDWQRPAGTAGQADDALFVTGMPATLLQRLSGRTEPRGCPRELSRSCGSPGFA